MTWNYGGLFWLLEVLWQAMLGANVVFRRYMKRVHHTKTNMETRKNGGLGLIWFNDILMILLSDLHTDFPFPGVFSEFPCEF